MEFKELNIEEIETGLLELDEEELLVCVNDLSTQAVNILNTGRELSKRQVLIYNTAIKVVMKKLPELDGLLNLIE